MLIVIIIVLSNMKVLAAERVKLDFVIPEYIEPPTSYEEVTKRILAWQEIIPDNTIWNEHTPYGDEGYLGEYYEWTTWNGNILRTTACSAFAYVINNGTFGKNAPVYLNTNVKFEDIKPGDVLTINDATHCVIVVQVYNEYDCIRIAEGNSNGVVNWNSVLSKRYLMERINYLETRYPDGFVDGKNTTPATIPTAVPVSTQTPVPTKVSTATPVTAQTPAPTKVPTAKRQEIEKSYRYLYDSNNNELDIFRLKNGRLTYKNKQLPLKAIKWADFNKSAHIIAIKQNGVYYSIKYENNRVEIEKLGKDAIKRKKKHGLIISVTTKHGKVNVANL